jgi:hypothetical protein
MSGEKVYRILAFGDSLTEVRNNNDHILFISKSFLIRVFILLAFVIIHIQLN